MNPAGDHFLVCDCKRIIDELLEFVKETTSDFGEEQRKKCEIYAQQYFCRNVPVISDTDGVDGVPKLCSRELCSMLLKELSVIALDFNFKLSTLITDFIIYVYRQQHCLYNANSDSWKFMFVEGCILDKRYPDSTNVFRILIALNGRHKLMKTLVKLGLISSVKNNLIWEILYMTGHIQYFISLYTDDDNSESPSMINNIMKSAESIFFLNRFYRSYIRMILAMVSIKAAHFKLQMEENTAREYIDCIRLFFVATSNPLLTINEVRSMLYSCLHYLQKLDKFESYSETFVKLMPESSANYQPRNLTDLVRCEIRGNLKKCNLPLSAAVEKLDLPRLLKRFVIGDIIQTSRNSGNIFPESVITMTELAGRLFQGEHLERERSERHLFPIEDENFE